MTNDIVSGKIINKGKKYHVWKIGELNIQTCSDDQKMHIALLECCRANLDIVCLQEVRLLGTDSRCHLNYDFHWCGMKRLLRNGVAIAIKKSPDIVTDGIINVSDRLMAADVTVKGCKLRIISCYAPTLLGSSLTTKQTFYRELYKLTKVEKHRKLMIQGDFNCEPEFCRTNSYYDGGRSTTDDRTDYTNENVMLFLDFCQKCELSILNTWFQHPIHHRITWHHPDKVTKKVYDYSLSESWLRQYVKDVRVRNSFFTSDHRLVVTIMKTPANKAARHFIKKNKKRRTDMTLLQDAAVKQNIQTTIQNHLQSSTPSSLEDTHNHIIEALEKGKAKVPLQTQQQQRQTIPWTNDAELTQLYNKRIEVLNQQNQNGNEEKLKEIKKKIMMLTNAKRQKSVYPYAGE